jgi:small subunit ribosomal protein S24e
MEIEINEKKNNPLFNRTEVYFTITHEGEGTPNREIIRSEIAEKLNVKKENIIIDNISSSFGIQQSRGYAKVYANQKKAETLEKKYILKRNQVIKKEIKKEEDKKETMKGEAKAESSDVKDKKIESNEKKEETKEVTKEEIVKDEKSENKSEKTDEKKE